MQKKKNKQYIVRKYVIAKDVKEALRKERLIPADEAWIDPEWQKVNPEIGYKTK
jgi:hypothetical protein